MLDSLDVTVDFGINFLPRVSKHRAMMAQMCPTTKMKNKNDALLMLIGGVRYSSSGKQISLFPLRDFIV